MRSSKAPMPNLRKMPSAACSARAGHHAKEASSFEAVGERYMAGP